MFGVTRFDPTASNANSTEAAPANTGLDALKARLASKKAEREAATAPAPAAEAEQPSTEAPVPKAPKAKTKAKERYLKKKSNRRKASKKPGTTISLEEQEKKANETPEEKLKRKRALKEARKERRAAAAAAAAAEEKEQADADVSPQHEDVEDGKEKADGEHEETKEERKARRKAEKEAKRARKALEQDIIESKEGAAAEEPNVEPTDAEAVEEPQKKKRRKTESSALNESEAQSKASASAAKIISKATKASKRSAAAVEAALKALNSDPESEDDIERNVEQLDALPVFRKPAPLAAPDSNLLAELSIARELSKAYQVDSRTTTGFEELCDACQLGQNLRTRLAKLDIEHFFAVQSAVLPLLLSPAARHRRRFPWPVRDLCINAPTGSGKTLSYVLPIIESLSSYTGTRKLRALILLPTKDLVQQLKETFDALILGTDIKVGTATGQLSFPKEQAKLATRFGVSPVDILIATPGRLMDHIAETADFSLEDLDFFVVDEADRLLAQSFNDWLPSVMDALHDAMNTGNSHTPLKPAIMPSKRKVQKLLLSATLSRDPVQISALKLHQPLYISVSDATTPASEFSLPATLNEHMIVCSGALKPLMLVHILRAHQITHGICFTKSTEAASRLVKLLEFLQEELRGEPLKVASFSSDLPGNERSKLLNAFKAGQISLLVCSDLISRGIDLPQVSHVINYDVPVDLRKYVHRVGRTARAGRSGDAWSLVENQEAAFFKNMHRQAGRLEKIKRLRVGAEVVEPMTTAYEKALAKLKSAVVRS